jgi:hypothetical protein
MSCDSRSSSLPVDLARVVVLPLQFARAMTVSAWMVAYGWPSPLAAAILSPSHSRTNKQDLLAKFLRCSGGSGLDRKPSLPARLLIPAGRPLQGQLTVTGHRTSGVVPPAHAGKVMGHAVSFAPPTKPASQANFVETTQGIPRWRTRLSETLNPAPSHMTFHISAHALIICQLH